MSTVFPPLAASVPAQFRFVTVTAWPFSVQLPFQFELIDSEAAVLLSVFYQWEQ